MKKRIITLKEMLNISVQEQCEDIVCLNDLYPHIICWYGKHQKEMLELVGDHNVYVRLSVAHMLNKADTLLKNKFGQDVHIKISYGYRHPSIQKKRFTKMKNKFLNEHSKQYTDEQINSIIHNFVAFPDAAGHPTGGAVDVTITSTDGDWDMGTAIADFSNTQVIPTYNAATIEQQERRLILHDVMIEAGFAPFYGEWWHFAYGEREWAAFYSKPFAIYDQVEINKFRPTIHVKLNNQ